jgi:hypothetical protein
VAQLMIAAALSLVLAGYAAGRRVGRSEGRREGRAAATLELRQSSYETGACPLCGAAPAGGPRPACYNETCE